MNEYTSYTDPITRKEIPFSPNITLKIYIKRGATSKTFYKSYKSVKAQEAFTEFYSLEIPKKMTKYLQLETIEQGEVVKTVLVSVHGWGDGSFKIKKHLTRKEKCDYKHNRDFRVLYPPVSMASDLANDNLKLDFGSRLNKGRIYHLILSHYLSCSKEEKFQILKKGFDKFKEYQLKDGGTGEYINPEIFEEFEENIKETL